MRKRVAVLFSSGLDSTYLVWKNLKDGNFVYPIYVEIENNRIKTILEKNRVELLFKEFEKEFPCDHDGRKIRNINYAVKVSVSTSESALYFKQMPIWMFTLMYCQSLEVDEIQIGYVSNDDAISYLDDIQNIYKSYQSICEPMKPLVFPLSKKKKYMMAQELPKQYMDLIFSCEGAEIIGPEDAEFVKYEPCGTCVPCNHIIADNYYETNRFPDNYKNAILKNHAFALRHAGYIVVDDKGEDLGTWGSLFKKEKVREKAYQLELQFEPYEIEMEAKLIAGCGTINNTITITKTGDALLLTEKGFLKKEEKCFSPKEIELKDFKAFNG